MIVRDEEAMLPAALASVEPFADRAIVVDTGSTDRTVAVAEAAGAEVFAFAWTGSFSEARNESLRVAPRGWTLILDADERVRGPAWMKLPSFLARQAPTQVIAPKIVNETTSGDVLDVFFAPRIFFNDGHLCYRGLVHNRLEHATAAGREPSFAAAAELEIEHFGYDPSIQRRKRKSERSLPLIRAELERDPSSPVYRWYLAREYGVLGRLEDALSILEPLVLELTGSGQVAFYNAACTFLQAVEARSVEAEYAETLARIHAQAPRHPEFLWSRARLHAATGARDEAIEAALSAVQALDSSEPALGAVRPGHIAWRARELAAEQLLAKGAYARALACYQACIDTRPDAAPGWGPVLTNATALAIELGRRELTESLLDRLVARPEAHLGMLLFEIRRRLGAGDPVGARALWNRHAAHRARLRACDDTADLERRLRAADAGR